MRWSAEKMLQIGCNGGHNASGSWELMAGSTESPGEREKCPVSISMQPQRGSAA